MQNMQKRRIKILYVQKVPIGGTVTGLIELIKGLDFNCYEPIVLFPETNRYKDNLTALGVKVINFKYMSKPKKRTNSQVINRDIAQRLSLYGLWLGNGYRALKQLYIFIRNDLPIAYRLRRLIKNLNIDLVHHNDNLAADRATVLGTCFTSIPQVCHIRTLKPLSYIEKFLSRFVDSFIYMSNSIETLYLKHGISAKKGQVIYDAFSYDDYKGIDGNQIADIRSEFKLSNDEWLVCNIGRLARWKGQDIFIKAMAEVKKCKPNTKAIIVGPTNSSMERKTYFKELQKLVHELELSNHVIFTGFRSDIPQIIGASDIVVHSSSEPEPFGRVIVEGMLGGKPVIATAAGGVLDIIRDQETGFLVPIKNPAAMANAINYLLINPEIAKRMGDKAKQDAIRRFNTAQHVQAVQNIYENILLS